MRVLESAACGILVRFFDVFRGIYEDTTADIEPVVTLHDSG